MAGVRRRVSSSTTRPNRRTPATSTNYADVVDRQLSFFTELFGTYPFDRYGIALADSASGLAMETQGLPLFSQRRPRRLTRVLPAPAAGARAGAPVVRRRRVPGAVGRHLAQRGMGHLLRNGCGSTTRDSTRSTAWRSARCCGLADGGGPVSRPDDLFGGVTYDGGGAALHALRLTIGDADVLRRGPVLGGGPHGLGGIDRRLPSDDGGRQRARPRRLLRHMGPRARSTGHVPDRASLTGSGVEAQ